MRISPSLDDESKTYNFTYYVSDNDSTNSGNTRSIF